MRARSYHMEAQRLQEHHIPEWCVSAPRRRDLPSRILGCAAYQETRISRCPVRRILRLFAGTLRLWRRPNSRRALRRPVRNTSSLLKSRVCGMCLRIVGEEVCCESVRGARVRKPHRAGSKSEIVGILAKEFCRSARKRRIAGSTEENTRKRAGDRAGYRKFP